MSQIQPPVSQPPPPPPTLVYAAPPSADAMRGKLHEIARRQRLVVGCIVAYIVLLIAYFATPSVAHSIVSTALFALMILSAVFVFMLAVSVYGNVIGLLLGALTLAPIGGLIVLALINAKATSVLRHYGIRVGLMGADMSQVPNA